FESALEIFIVIENKQGISDVMNNMGTVYFDQGNYEKAINIYRKLSLKFPEKSSYFAAQIEKINKGQK
ncbi:MAG: tetratricopeptide repeat protein, partial [Bacteroidales bacterium]|nr:tetratricopeptide repeat protein [Bacteroidales bacterium]